MLEKYFPSQYIDNINEIDLAELSKSNIKGLILDIDNTLVPSHVRDADANALRWIEKVKKAGFKVCIVSNATMKRVIRFNERLNIPAIHRAYKPGSKAFLKAADLMGTSPSATAVIGDQIFTDIYGGNRIGMHTILVNPLDRREFFFIKFKRLAEKYVMLKYRKYKNSKITDK